MAEEKGFREVKCGGCGRKLKFAVTASQYGKTLTIRCPKCETKGRVTIPHPPKEEEQPKVPPPPKRPVSPNPLGDLMDDLFDPFDGRGFQGRGNDPFKYKH